ncbi:hypothetical protein VNO78_12741 [Psophocarpus tetragonolobus]|uniref:Uncharacterized protein n=1 Tax=Psophocarpus tetragonolobus TaxID=3891 RepID=A0AAN9SNF8_PSOTE
MWGVTRNKMQGISHGFSAIRYFSSAMKEMNVRETLNSALNEEMSADPKEARFAGIGVGAACYGSKPVVEFMTHNFSMQNHMGFRGTRVMEIVKKHDSGGLVWKRIKLTTTRKANAKKRLLRVWQNEAVLKACSEPSSATATKPQENLAN